MRCLPSAQRSLNDGLRSSGSLALCETGRNRENSWRGFLLRHGWVRKVQIPTLRLDRPWLGTGRAFLLKLCSLCWTRKRFLASRVTRSHHEPKPGCWSQRRLIWQTAFGQFFVTLVYLARNRRKKIDAVFGYSQSKHVSTIVHQFALAFELRRLQFLVCGSLKRSLYSTTKRQQRWILLFLKSSGTVCLLISRHSKFGKADSSNLKRLKFVEK